MLAIPAPFPHAGSFAFVAGTAERVRIIRTDQHAKTAFVALDDAHAPRIASGNFNTPLSDLHPTRDAALGLHRGATAAQRRAAEAAAAVTERNRA